MSHTTNKSTTITPFWERWVGFDRQRSLNLSHNDQSTLKDQKDEELLPLQQNNSQMSSYGACLRTRNRTSNFVKHKVTMYYRVFNMDQGHFKELLWLHFWCQTFYSPSFLWWKNVFILIFGIKKFYLKFQRAHLPLPS